MSDTDEPNILNSPLVTRPPWTEDQVATLNRWQAGPVHPFTCPNDELHGVTEVTLVATADGWVCSVDECGYRQDWAHEFMARPEVIQNMEDQAEAMRTGTWT